MKLKNILFLLIMINGCKSKNKEIPITELSSYKYKKNTTLVIDAFEFLDSNNIQFFKDAKSNSKYLVVALEPDEYIIKHENRFPFHDHKERIEMLTSIKYIDEIVLLPNINDASYKNFIDKIKPNVVKISSNDLDIDRKKNLASSVYSKIEIIQINSNNTLKYNKLNGLISLKIKNDNESDLIHGIVIPGTGNSIRELNMPTANIEIPKDIKKDMKYGLYLCKAQISQQKQKYDGVCYYNEERPNILEIHLINFNENIYGKKIFIRLKNHLRANVKFDSKDEMIKKIQQDRLLILNLANVNK